MQAIINAEAFARALAAVIPAADDGRRQRDDLTWLHIEADARRGAVTIVATDGHALHAARLPAADIVDGHATIAISEVAKTLVAGALTKLRVGAMRAQTDDAKASADRLVRYLACAVVLRIGGGKLEIGVEGDATGTVNAALALQERPTWARAWREVARTPYAAVDAAAHAWHVSIDPRLVARAAEAARVFSRGRPGAFRSLAPTTVAEAGAELRGPVFYVASASTETITPDRLLMVVMPIRAEALTPADPLGWFDAGAVEPYAPAYVRAAAEAKRAAGGRK